uniref:exo-alpha-sialidase n=1 Tax=Strigops habroptila TaxID=2489341 RepID=A0A672VAX1_STRHB
RIPALLYIPSAATFLAFAEKRSSARDEDAKYLVLRRGQRHGPSVQVKPTWALTLPGRRTMNPCPLYDSTTGTIFLFCICVEQGRSERCQLWSGCSAARLCFATSTDGGRGWTPLRDVTDEAIGADLSRWATFAVGPGHGIQLDSGRLVVPAYTYYIHRRLCGVLPLPCSTRQHSLVFYSDDNGRRWHKGALVGGQRTGECQVAEINGNDPDVPMLYCSARAPRGCRAVALSTDLGLRFQPPARCRVLGEPPRGCQGSVVSFPAPRGSGTAPTWLLYSHPIDRHRVNPANIGKILRGMVWDGLKHHHLLLHPTAAVWAHSTGDMEGTHVKAGKEWEGDQGKFWGLGALASWDGEGGFGGRVMEG